MAKQRKSVFSWGQEKDESRLKKADDALTRAKRSGAQIKSFGEFYSGLSDEIKKKLAIPVGTVTTDAVTQMVADTYEAMQVAHQHQLEIGLEIDRIQHQLRTLPALFEAKIALLEEIHMSVRRLRLKHGSDTFFMQMSIPTLAQIYALALSGFGVEISVGDIQAMLSRWLMENDKSDDATISDAAERLSRDDDDDLKAERIR
jgi:hypothetical protein